MNCAHCEERSSDYLENTLSAAECKAMRSHLSACPACTELLSGMSEILEWGTAFPTYEAPPWLATKIIANTPRVVRETWVDILAGIGRWILEPRTAMGLLTAVLMIGWMGSLAPVPATDLSTIVQNPSAIYYEAYDEVVRAFYRAPLVTEIRAEIERLREIS